MNPHFTATSGLKSNQYMIHTKNIPFYTIISHGAVTGCSIWFQKFTLIRFQGFGPIKRPLMVSIDSNIRKVLKMGIKPKYGENPTSRSLKKLPIPESTRSLPRVERFSFSPRRPPTVEFCVFLERSFSLYKGSLKSNLLDLKKCSPTFLVLANEEDEGLFAISSFSHIKSNPKMTFMSLFYQN